MKNTFKDQALKQIQELAAQMKNYPWEQSKFYGAWLAQTYYYVAHSTRLLTLAASRFPVKQDALHQRFIAHAHEEKKHERLAELDLKHLGFSLTDIEEFPATSAFYQTQYYWIEHVDPKAFFGYIVMLEGLAVTVGADLYRKIKSTSGDKTGQFLKVHSEEDQDHIEKAFAMLSDLNSESMKAVSDSFKQSLFLYRQMLESCRLFAESLPEKSRKAA